MRLPIGTRFKLRKDTNWFTITGQLQDNIYICKLVGSSKERLVTCNGVSSLSVEIEYPKEELFDDLYRRLL